MIKNSFFLGFITVVTIFVSSSVKGQKKFSLETSGGALHSVGKDLTRTYKSFQPLTVEYFSRKKFDNTYFNFLANLNYSISSNVLIGF